MNPHTNQGHTSYFSAKGTSPCYGVGVKREYISSSSAKTKKFGEKLAKQILKKKLKKRAFVIGLEGELGGGKTTFLQGFARGLGIREKILSPTFVIMKKFKIRGNSYSNSCKFANLYHIDCYRIQKPKELIDLGFKEIISEPKNIVVIEWADRVRKIIPKTAIWIKFKFIDKNRRMLIIC